MSQTQVVSTYVRRDAQETSAGADGVREVPIAPGYKLSKKSTRLREQSSETSIAAKSGNSRASYSHATYIARA